MLHLSAALQHFLFNTAFVQLCGGKKNWKPPRQQNNFTHISLLWHQKKKQLSVTGELPKRDTCMQILRKKIVHAETMGGERRTLLVYSEKVFIFFIFFQFISVCTLSWITERGGRRKWKEKKKSETVVCNFILICFFFRQFCVIFHYGNKQ